MLCFVLAPLLFTLCSRLPFGPPKRKVLQFLKLGCHCFITHGVAELFYPETMTAFGALLVDFEQMPTVLQFEKLHLCSLWAVLFQDGSLNGDDIAIENPKDPIVQSDRIHGQRAVLKFAQYIGVHAITGEYIPRALTNRPRISFNDPRHPIPTTHLLPSFIPHTRCHPHTHPSAFFILITLQFISH
ncbi:hypothetical protein PVL29_005250 [Vitis rotundifolia]|uniref:Uncharacterized protein n=1 Tax=Vitis rotundifolia TaxID=103349 RepID=A0AA39ABC9_VITRO|nr:hypothetical protein PVL29_005250 [Vitis rotundifolia]